MDIQKILTALPLTSGVYVMKDANGRILYIGKAVSLRKRVQSYFRSSISPSSKTGLLVRQIRDIDHIPTASEAEALLLEASLIKKHQPRFNVDLRDDKSYPSILITQEQFPRVTIVRERTRSSTEMPGQFFGPYVEATLIREALTIIRRIFHFRSCRQMPASPCLDYHIGLCDAPCAGLISVRDYRQLIHRVRCVLNGRKDALYRDLQKEMEVCVRRKAFERAAILRDQIRAIGALYASNQDLNFCKEAEQLQRALGLAKAPQRIEAFDISNIMGAQAVGSMVSFLNGRPDKSQYRRFRIGEVEGIDDPAMIAEVVRRRYHRLKKEGALYPDLIVIDGGKGQLAAAQDQLADMALEIPIAALAKKEEVIFFPHRKNPIVLAKDSLGLHLLQRIRDEAHRFALGYHRVLRKRAMLKSDEKN